MALLVIHYATDTGRFFSQLIGAAQIANNAIVSGKLADNSIHLEAIPNGLLTSAKIAALAIGDGHIVSGIGANKLLSGYLGYKVTSGYAAAGLTGALPVARVSGVIISGLTISNGALTLPAFTIDEDLTARAGTVLASGAGVVDIVDGAIAASGFGSGLEVGYYYRLGGMPFLRTYAEQDGLGGLKDRRVEFPQPIYGGGVVPVTTSGGYIASAFISGGLRDNLMASGITAQKLTGFVLPARISGLPYANLALSGTITNTDLLSGITAAKILSGYGGFDGTSGYVLTARGPGSLPTQAPLPIPRGIIVMWSGTIATIPSGFVICDGNNGTPNLLARFVEGVATAATNPGTTGGDNTPRLAETITGSRGSQADVGYVRGFDASSTPGDYTSMSVGSSEGGLDYEHRIHNTLADGRPLFYDVAFIMKT